MSAEPLTQVSSLPAIAFLVPFAAGVVVFLGRRLPRAFAMGVTVGASALTFATGLSLVRSVIGGVVLTAWGNELRVDALSALLVTVIGGIGVLTALYSLRYVSHPGLLTQ